MMSIRVFSCVLLLVTVIFAPVNPLPTVRSYLIKGRFQLMRSLEFAIFDAAGVKQQYRIESQFGTMENPKVVAYPSKEIVATLQEKFVNLMYNGIISILDPTSDEWISGKIYHKFLDDIFIEWNGHRVRILRKKGDDRSLFFRDEINGTILANSEKKSKFKYFSIKYDVKVFSDELPDAIYFLGIAVANEIAKRQSSRGK
ncbi:unnamed protein product [Adineta steineri]|uniref:Uncharacterized protein n=1 Tax=Adineta steineri TaxID=433720 RepID=A0A814KHY1_9BILA|nr:unnamed protein product [Adineta steineri]CAF1042346.1 unnamed protein product [Adineta steineri]CAF1051294.1 unnamed protein product [Adineta steineri]